MEAISFSSPDALKAFVRAQVAKEDFPRTSKYVQALIREDQQGKHDEKLEALLLAEFSSGRPTELTAADWQGMRREVKKRLSQPRTT